MIEFNSRQTIVDYTEAVQAIAFKNDNGTEDYMAMKADVVNIIAALLQDYVPLQGTGTPENSVAANRTQLYVDTAVPQLYFNPAPGSDTGWLAL